MNTRIFVFAGILLFLFGIAFWIYRGLSNVEFGENMAHVDWLPGEAANVSYYKSYTWTAYEFDISEEGFRKWSKWEIAPIEQPVSIARYSFMPALKARSREEVEKATAIVSNGLYYEQRDARSGGGTVVVFDRDASRVYYQRNPR